MAPQYAPSLRSCLAPLFLSLQIGFIIIYAFYAEFETKVADGNTFRRFYSEFQDVNVALVLGFGFLGTFLVRYGFSSISFNLLVVVVSTQWAVVLSGLESWYYRGKILVNLKSLVVGEICAASALVSIGSVIGKINPIQLVFIALLEVTGLILNGWLVQTLLDIKPVNSFMMLHVFGAFFGLMLSWVLDRKESEQEFEKEKSGRNAGLFSILGTLFLWMFWPTFNSIQMEHTDPRRKLEAVYSTYLALSVSAVTAAAWSVLSSPRGRLNMAHIHRCSLAGGVAIGVSMSVVHEPWVAMVIGYIAAMVSTLGLRYLKTHMVLAFKNHDTCGVLITHGLPGLLGWLAYLVLESADCDDLTTATRFAVFHIAILLITLGLSMSMGSITGLLLRWSIWRPPQHNKCFDDQAFWEFPHLAVKK